MRITVKEDRAIAHTRPTPVVLKLLPLLEGQRRWLANGSLSFTPSRHNLDVFREAFEGLAIDYPEKKPLSAEFDPDRSYKPAPHLAHQATALEKMKGKRHFALFMEQGTGKTKVAIDRAGEFWARGAISAVLIVTKNGVHRQWIEDAMPEYCGCEWQGAYWPTKGRRLPANLSHPGGTLKAFAINYDGVKTKAGYDVVQEFIKAHEGTMIITDESQEIKNHASARFKAMTSAKKLAGNDQPRMLLTGTPIAKDLTDEWAQLRWLNEDILGIKYLTTFKARFCQMGGFEGKQVVGTKNMEEFRALTDPHSFRVTRQEIGLLPPEFKRWTFDLRPEQRKAMQAMKANLEHKLDSGEIVSSANAAVAVQKLQQIANGFIMDEEKRVHHIIPPSKNPRALAMLEYLDAYPGKHLVWARYRADIEIITAVLRERGIGFVEYHGGVDPKERPDNIRRFIEEEDCRIFVSNTQTGGTGLDGIQYVCNQALYYSNSQKAIDRWQSQARIDRIGMTGAAIFTDLIAKGSTDNGILLNHKKKKNLSDLALGDIRELLKEVDDE